MVKLTKAQRKALFKVFQRDFPGWVTPTRRYDQKPITCPCCGHVIGGATVKVPSLQWRSFRKKVVGVFGEYGEKGGPVMLAWQGMWLGIEQDGHTHS